MWCWGQNLGPMQEQQMLFTPEPYLHLQLYFSFGKGTAVTQHLGVFFVPSSCGCGV